MGSKSFASRARDSDPTLSPADQILAVADTLLAGDRRIGNNQQDWYAILRIAPSQGRDADLIANQYRSLALLLNPQKNKFPFAEQAFRLVVDAWSVLSNPSRKSSYDKELSIYESYSTFAGNVAKEAPGTAQKQVNEYSNNNNQPQQNYSNVGDKTANHVNVNENVGDRTDNEECGERVDAPEMGDGSTIWTSCPYCYYMYEYPSVYADCTLRCQNCKKAFQAVSISSPPPVADGQEGYFCCWGFLPMGFSMETWEKSKNATPSWTPFSPMFTCPQGFNDNDATKKTPRKSPAPRVYIDEDDVFVEISDSSESDDVDWQKDTEKRKKKAKIVKGKGASGTPPTKSTKKLQAEKGKNVSAQDGSVYQNVDETLNKIAGESSKKGSVVNARKQPGRVAKSFGKLDLNVEFSNEPEESVPKVNQENGSSRGEEENIEGIGFFEGLDEFLSSLPILNVVGDDKVVKAA
ncbi:uncharacterized protein at4g38065 [Phtheirospermum japonicum]|uniref:Uncharacterized protein at4g38065 n=1 Tax=Phtheirospermum japonicum TaxID=374723 RepID=A0A830CWP4_9LAMI|nr:uncharacterized protein at4g38065 [Phtheirospermum japonicum]